MKHKMKHLQSLVAVVLCFIFAMCLTSCSKDDDEPAKPKVEKRMTSVDDQSFVYTDGKITQIKRDDSYWENIKYTESTIKIGYETFYVKDGLVTKLVDSEGNYEEFTYENGRIKTWKKYYEGILDEDISFEWKDGVIIRQTDIERDDFDSERMELFCEYEYTYTPNPDYGGAVAVFQTNSMFYDDLPIALIIQGYFGKWPKYLVSEAVDVTGNFESSSYTYKLDSDGYPISMSGSEDAQFTWEKLR